MKSISLSTLILRFADTKSRMRLGIFILGAVLLTTIQDFIHSYFNNYSFYISESLLYKSFWVLFFPLVIAQWYVIMQRRSSSLPENKVSSMVLATLIPTLLHMLLFPLALYLLSALLFSHTYSFVSSLEYTLREDLYKYLLIYGLISYAGFSLKGQAAVKSVNPPSNTSENDVLKPILTVKNGRKNIAVKVDEILYISSANPYISIHTSTGRHLHLSTLKAISNELPVDQFVRVHKSAIINIRAMLSYKSRLNGDYDITLLNGEVIRMSRNYTQAFKKHLA